MMKPSISVPNELAQRIKKIARVRRQSVSDALRFLIPLAQATTIETSTDYSGDGVSLQLPPEYSGVGRADLVTRLTALSRSLPNLIRRTDGPSPLPLDCEVTADGLGLARLPNGRIFYDHAKVSPRETAMFNLVRDLLPAHWGTREYHMAIAVQQRYLKYLENPEAFAFPQVAKTAIDAGCYVGFKAIAMADIMGPRSRIIAVEMGDENFSLLQRNIVANGLQGRIIPVHAAISDKDGTSHHYLRGTGMMGNTIVNADLSVGTGREIQTRSLASIFEEVGVDEIDYLNVQLNGAEPLAIAGLGAWLNKVNTYFVACPYAVDGRPIKPRILEQLVPAGYEPLEEGKEGRVIAFRAKADPRQLHALS